MTEDRGDEGTKMEDHDWIEIAYLLASEPSVEQYESLFDAFPRRPGPEYGPGEFNVNGWDGGTKHHEYGGCRAAAGTVASAEAASVGVWMGRYELQVMTSRDHSLFTDIPHVRFSAEIYAFEEPDDPDRGSTVEARRREFADVLASAAAILDPTWGFGRRGGIATGEDDSVAALAATREPPLYEYNVFQPETVDHLGREPVLSAPVWHVEETDTGGVLLIVRAPPKACWQGTEQYVAAADHLGVSIAATDRYR